MSKRTKYKHKKPKSTSSLSTPAHKPKPSSGGVSFALVEFESTNHGAYVVDESGILMSYATWKNLRGGRNKTSILGGVIPSKGSTPTESVFRKIALSPDLPINKSKKAKKRKVHEKRKPQGKKAKRKSVARTSNAATQRISTANNLKDSKFTEQALKQSNDEQIYGGKHLGHMQREWGGKFGSLPLYDDYEDESDAN